MRVQCFHIANKSASLFHDKLLNDVITYNIISMLLLILLLLLLYKSVVMYRDMEDSKGLYIIASPMQSSICAYIIRELFRPFSSVCHKCCI